MKKSAAALLAAMLVTGGMTFSTTSASANTTITTKALKEWQVSKEIALDKKWTVTFNQAIAKGTDLKKYVFVVDHAGQVVATNAFLSDNQKQITIAPVKKYDAAASYTLIIKEGLPSTKGKALKDTIHKKFETRNPVSYGHYEKSYAVENTSTSTSTVSLAQPADYIVYDKANQVKKQYINAKEVALDKGELAIISYKKNASKPTIIHGSATVKETEQEAYKLVNLEQHGTVEIANNHNQNRIDFYLDDSTKNATYSYATYRQSNGSAMSLRMGNMTSTVASSMVLQKTDTVFTNTSNATLTLRVPNKSTTVKQVNEEVLTSYKLLSQKNVAISSLAASLANENMPYLLSNQLNKGTYNYATYSQNNTTTSFGEQELEDKYVEGNVVNNGKTIVQNTGTSTIELLVPARVAHFEGTEEKALKYYTLNPSKSMSVTTTEKSPSFSTNYAAKAENGQRYNEVSYNAAGNLITQSERLVNNASYGNGNQIFVGFENIVENVSTTPIMFYGPARFVQFKESKEKALIYYTVKPGEKVTVRTSEPKGTEASSDYVIQDKTMAGAFSTEQFTKDGQSLSKYENKFNYAENITSYLNFGEGYQVSQNKGNVDLTLIGTARYITFGK